MTSQSPRIYIYKITFEEVLYYYYGVHKEKYFNEEYWGSPVTHKWMWNFYTPKKQILEIFPFTDEGWLEAQEVEKRIIKPVFNTDKWCLNENCGGIISTDSLIMNGKISGNKNKELGLGICGLTYEERVKYSKNGRETQKKNNLGIYEFTVEQKIEYGKIGGNVCKEKNLGVCGLSKEELSNAGKIGGPKSYKLGLGVHGRTKEQMTEDGKKGGYITGPKFYELGIGIHGRTKEQMSEDGKKGAQKAKELCVGLYGVTTEQRSETAKKVNSQKWMCLETGYVANPGALSTYQKNRGIDTSKRVKIS